MLYKKVALLFFFLLILTSCSPGEKAATEPSMTENEDGHVYVASDDWRSYYYDPESIERWTDSEGNDIIDVFVRIEYSDNPGNVSYEIQLWHLDPKEQRYKISDAYAFEADGSPQET